MVSREDRQVLRESKARQDHRFIGGSTHTHTHSIKDNSTVIRDTKVASAPRWGPEAVGCSLIPGSPRPTWSFLGAAEGGGGLLGRAAAWGREQRSRGAGPLIPGTAA
jgi:hypothetical protein